MKFRISDYYECEELPKEIELISFMMFVLEKVEKVYYQEVQNEANQILKTFDIEHTVW